VGVLKTKNMYYNEQWFEGKLYYKTTPNGDWKPFTQEMLYKRIVEREEEILILKHTLNTVTQPS
jgi:hypothetical protein